MNSRRDKRFHARKAERLKQIASLREGGRLSEALATARRLAKANAGHADVHNALGLVLQRLGRFREATVAFRHALSLHSGLADIHYNLARALHQSGALEDAEASFRAALVLSPNDVEILSGCAICNMQMHRTERAIAYAEQAARLAPNDLEVRLVQVRTLIAGDRPEMALESACMLVEAAPDNPIYLTVCGQASLAAGDTRTARQHLEAARQIKPDDAHILSLLGRVNIAEGNVEAARANFRQAISIRPEMAALYADLASLGGEGLEPADADRLRGILDTGDASVVDGAELHLALAAMHRAWGNLKEGFAHTLRGNALKRQLFDYDVNVAIRDMEGAAKACDASFVSRLAGAGSRSQRPIFVVGMPRSGTTLVEQILANHDDVHGAGELMLLPRLIRASQAEAPEGMRTARFYTDLSAGRADALAASYLAELDSLCPDLSRVVDKLPGNYLYLGFIAACFPEATIVECRRDPLDTCLSCFETNFTHGHAYTYDMGELGRYYQAYDRLMRHWHEIFPNRIHIVQYEKLVAESESTTACLLAACGLSWQDACLEFHRASRPVFTASASQVRRPLYRASVGRAQQLEDQLAPLAAALTTA